MGNRQWAVRYYDVFTICDRHCRLPIAQSQFNRSFNQNGYRIIEYFYKAALNGII